MGLKDAQVFVHNSVGTRFLMIILDLSNVSSFYANFRRPLLTDRDLTPFPVDVDDTAS